MIDLKIPESEFKRNLVELHQYATRKHDEHPQYYSGFLYAIELILFRCYGLKDGVFKVKEGEPINDD